MWSKTTRDHRCDVYRAYLSASFNAKARVDRRAQDNRTDSWGQSGAVASGGLDESSVFAPLDENNRDIVELGSATCKLFQAVEDS